MRDLGLALRLVRGAGRRDGARFALLVVGTAVATLGLLLGTVVPRVSSEAGGVLQARTVRTEGPGESARTELRVVTSSDELAGRPWTRVVVSGTGTDSPLPPGLAAWPAPGRSVLSPALAEALSTHPDARLSAPDPVAERIGPAGLTAPDEYVSYTAVPAGRPALSTGRAVSFGAPGDPVAATPAGLRAVELAVLVIGPASLFLVVLLRAAAAARRPRFRSLQVVGMSPRRCAKVFGWEMGATTGVGATLGVAAYAAMQGGLGRSGLLGRAWWPHQGAVSLIGGVVLVVVTTTVARWAARHTVLREARTRRTRGRPRRTGLTGLVLLAPSVACLAWLCARLATLPTDGGAPDSVALTSSVSTLAATVGLVLAAPVATAWAADVAARRAPRADVRLGLRGAAFHAGATGRLAALAAVVVVLAAYCSALLIALERDAAPAGPVTRIAIDVSTLSTSERDGLAALDLPATVVSTTATDASEVVMQVTTQAVPGVTATLHGALPSAPLTVGSRDDGLASAYAEQVAMVRAGLAVGTTLTLAALVVALLETWWSRRRTTAVLGAIGASSSALRIAAVTALAAPAVLAAGAGLVVGTLSGWATLAYWGTGSMIDARVPLAAAAPAVAVVAVTAAVGWLVGPRRVGRAALADR
ncbi:FtsX-like permease family protein [Cellulomonas sp.]|uniref:FtsX-like permease family protein n=1 Tax=Cellulomonas sp. TaxID=40001 RepID=UPI0025866A90|nr:FtsX-like permease family protein [Cellulomonas sp.]MCR6688082.1 hypothetical protein [Cellulomonas sp.]